MAFFSLNDIFGGPKAQPAQPKLGFDTNTGGFATTAYEVIEGNWFTAKPYGFKATFRNGATFTLFLPISPSNLTINTGFATNAVPTLYGTVEEHSPVRYYDITIRGTTGFAPKYVGIEQNKPLPGRTTVPVSQSLTNAAGGFFSKFLSVVDKIRNTASELINGPTKPETGLYIDQTGYVAFHNLYRFLLKHKEDAAGVDGSTEQRVSHPLTFFNYKDNNQYDVIVKNFVLERSAENPMLYYYSITLRGYNLRTASANEQAQDQMADRLKQLGLDGVDSSNFLGKLKGTANKVKGILGPLGAGINILGR